VEFRHITDEFHRVALAHPQLSFSFYNNGSDVFQLPANDFRKRIVHIFGRKTDEKLVPVNEDTQVVKISGFIQKPEFAKKSRGEQFFFANNRFIKSPYLHHAILGAFEGLIRPGTHPGYFINLDVDPATIDINIHPTKTEVKFDDEHTLYAILKSTVKHSLGQFNVIPALDFEQDQNLETPYAYRDKGAGIPQVSVDSSFNPFENVKSSRSTGATSYVKQNVQGWESMYEGLEDSLKSDTESSFHFESEVVNSSIFDGEKDTPENSTTTFQLRKKYIITTIKSGMVVINQSKAHQRVLYEKFLKNITIKEAISQQLLFPLTLSFSKGEVTILNEIKESLCTVGFVFGAITDDGVEIKGVPVLVAESEVQMIMEQLISDFQQEVPGDSFSQSDMLAKTLAKTLSVKTGETLDEFSQVKLVNDLFACKEPNVSPFNKRIYITITENDIDRKFI